MENLEQMRHFEAASTQQLRFLTECRAQFGRLELVQGHLVRAVNVLAVEVNREALRRRQQATMGKNGSVRSHADDTRELLQVSLL